MARRAQPLSASVLIGGGAALLLITALTFGTVAALASRATERSGLGPADWAALRFTLFQALLSALISMAAAIPVARALARRDFPGRRLMVSLLGVPFLLPAIVVVFGLLAIWGRGGLFSRALASFDLGPLDIYGATGVILAHVFFNLPLVARLLLLGWLAIPAEQFRLAAQLGFRPRDMFWRIEVPMLRDVLPGAFVLVFLLCMGSFAVALTLGGGPRATTVELAIYQAIRFDFDLGKAAWLALIQFALCGTVTLVAMHLSEAAHFGGGLLGQVHRWDASGFGIKFVDTMVLVLLVIFLGLPLLAILPGGVVAISRGLPIQVWSAALNSLLVALASAATTLLLGLCLAGLIDARRARGGGRFLEAFGMLSLAASPFVIGTGLFIVIYPHFDPFALALPVTALVNAAMALPFVLRALLPPLAAAHDIDGRLADSLGISGLSRFRLIIWPRLRPSVGFSVGLAAALSMGDLGIIALFAPPDLMTLPLLAQRLLASYRTEAAAGVALILVLLTYMLFWIFDRGGRTRAAA